MEFLVGCESLLFLNANEDRLREPNGLWSGWATNLEFKQRARTTFAFPPKKQDLPS
jgi:hypothetical protein